MTAEAVWVVRITDNGIHYEPVSAPKTRREAIGATWEACRLSDTWAIVTKYVPAPKRRKAKKVRK